MATVQQWVSAARPRTLPAAVAPVLIGTGAAIQLQSFRPIPALLALLVALALQIAVNYANDYSDGIRGTDDNRVGPFRLTGSGTVPRNVMKKVAVSWFAISAVLGLSLVAVTGYWWLLAVGVVALIAGWFYTGGKRPYGYLGYGEVSVFVFFGLVATLGTTYTQAGRLSMPAVLGAVGVGLIACCLLMVNNIRDIETDIVSGKRTLAVRLGERRARRTYIAFLWTAMVLGMITAVWAPWALLVTLLLLPAVLISLGALASVGHKMLITLLGITGLFEFAYGVLLGIGIAAS